MTPSPETLAAAGRDSGDDDLGIAFTVDCEKIVSIQGNEVFRFAFSRRREMGEIVNCSASNASFPGFSLTGHRRKPRPSIASRSARTALAESMAIPDGARTSLPTGDRIVSEASNASLKISIWSRLISARTVQPTSAPKTRRADSGRLIRPASSIVRVASMIGNLPSDGPIRNHNGLWTPR